MADTTKILQVQWLLDYQQALSQAKEKDKSIYLDFWFDG